MKIKPVEGRKLPFEDQPRRFVERETEVPETAYYRRAVKRGDVSVVATSKKVNKRDA